MKMASSRVFLLCGLLLAVLLLMAAQVSAYDLAEETQSQESVKEANYGQGYGEHGHGGKGYEGGYEKGHGDHGYGDHGDHGYGDHGDHGHDGHHGGHPP
ncbi:hypothetical protein EUGRSUZ_L01583 [Eucalyptus grandis]|uniref:Glycine-rich protein n=1 Tax=Eucalyptus grandis TaxID=71139 RepID=A0A058ZSQ6_EUCGR|nr:hypothetical protein EUGRSUZ_L01583 [Eucalyptus grandis]